MTTGLLDRNTHDKNTLESLAPFVRAGFALHWLHKAKKRPIGEDWSTRPVASLESLRRRHAPGNNLGVRLGEVSKLACGFYLHVCDIDIRSPEHAAAALLKLHQLLPELDVKTFPVVKSGSGGESRHVYFITDKPFASKKFARSEGFKMVWDEEKQREVKKRDWELEIFGTGKQVAMPPSIHPDTGLPYQWVRPFDFALLDLGLGPIVPSTAIERVGALDTSAPPEQGELKPRLGLTLDQARDILGYLPLDEWCEDRDGWVSCGMALHHEFGEDGFDLWTEFSQQSAKFDEKNQRVVWKSFRDKKNSVRMATLKAAAATERLRAMFDDANGDAFDGDAPSPAAVIDIDALIGTTAPKSAADELADFDTGEPNGRTALDELADFDSDAGNDVNPGELHWTSLLHLNEEGALRTTLHNTTLIVGNDVWTKGVMALNEFTHEVVQRGAPGVKAPRRKGAAKQPLQLEGASWQLGDPVNGDLWTEDKDNAIRALLEAPTTQGGYGIKVPDRDLRAAIDIIARRNAFHPVRERLNGLAWDGVPRLDRLFIDYLGTPDNSYYRDIARLTLTAAVTRVFEPGHKFDFAPILEGSQGKRKSTFIRILAMGWFAELDMNFDDRKQLVEKMQGAIIGEFPELSGMMRSEVHDVKAVITTQSDKVRLAYDKRAREFPRQCIFIGTTNDQRYLKDVTGGRRFWPVFCFIVGEIDTDRLERELDQLWAEAVHHYRSMRAAQPCGTLPLYLTDPRSKEISKVLQEAARVETADDAELGVITDWLNQPIVTGDLNSPAEGKLRDKTCLKELWLHALGRPEDRYDDAAARRLGKVMDRVEGWKNTGTTARFGVLKQQKAYRRVKCEVESLIG